MENMGKWLNFWIHERITSQKKERNHTGQHWCETETQWNHVTQSKENIKFFSYSADWPAHFKTLPNIKNVKLSVILSQDQEAVGCALNYLPSVRKEAMWKSGFSMLMRLACRTSSPILLVFASVVLGLWYKYVYNCYIFLMSWSFYQCMLSFVFGNNFDLKSLVWF